MRSRFVFFSIGIFISMLILAKALEASCGVCYIPREAGSADAESISSGPMLNSPTATTLGRHRSAGGFTFNHQQFNRIPAAHAHALHHADHDIHGKNHEEVYDMHAGFGLSEDIDVYISAPIVSKASNEIHSHSRLGFDETASGFGDMRLVGKYRFWKKYVEAAVLAGVKFPTGNTAELNSAGAKFEAEQQPGSGSWDGEFGLAASRRFRKRYSVASSFQYALRGEGAQDHKLGDVFQMNQGVSVALREPGQYPNVHAVVEINSRWALQDHSRETDRVFDSGGTTILATSGFHIEVTKNVAAFWAMPVPIYQNLGGEHEELK